MVIKQKDISGGPMDKKKLWPFALLLLAFVGLFLVGSDTTRQGEGELASPDSQLLNETPRANPPRTRSSTVTMPASEEILDMPFQALTENLSKLEQVPLLRKRGRILSTSLPALQAFARRQILQEDNSNIQVDFIWNMHPSVHDREDQLSQLRAGQQGIYTLLEQRNYALIGIEGQRESLFNYRGFQVNLRSGCQDAAREFGFPFEEATYHAVLTQMTQNYAPIRYLSDHPSQRAFGIEDTNLHRMHDDLMAFLRSNRVQGNFWPRFNECLLHARSAVALAKALEAARSNRCQRVVVIYGIAHQQGVTMMKQRFNIAGEDRVAPGTPSEVR